MYSLVCVHLQCYIYNLGLFGCMCLYRIDHAYTHAHMDSKINTPAISLVHRVDFAALGDLDVRVSEHELADGAVVGETCPSHIKKSTK